MKVASHKSPATRNFLCVLLATHYAAGAGYAIVALILEPDDEVDDVDDVDDVNDEVDVDVDADADLARLGPIH